MSKKKTIEDAAIPNDSVDLQEKYMKMQMLDQQVKQLQKYIENFDEQLSGVRGLIEAIGEFGKISNGEHIYAPLANGIFAKAKLEDNNNLLINVGNNVVASKSIDQTIDLLERQESQVQQYRSEALAQLQELMKQMESFD